jgi:hypothetical protein
MLRITIHEGDGEMEIKLEGRVAGPWVAELSRAWVEMAPLLASRKLSLDLRSVTFADAVGTQALKDIYTLTGAELVADTPWAQSLVEQITGETANPFAEEL